MPDASPRYAVIGAGLIGRLLAWRLAESSVQVTLFDRDLSGAKSAGLVAAAMLAPVSEALDNDPVIFNQGKQGMNLWRNWLTQLNRHISQPVTFCEEGCLLLAHAHDEAMYQRTLQRLQTQADIPLSDFSSLNQQALHQLEPGLTAFKKGCLFLPEGYLDNEALFTGLFERLDALGCEFTEQEINLSESHLQALLNTYDQVIDTRGMGASHDLPGLRGVRGEILRVHAPDVHIKRPIRLVHPRYRLYISPRPQNHYIAGATQIESDSEASVTVRSSLELLSALYTVHPGFAEGHITDFQVGLRPAFSDNLPAISKQSNLLRINGLFRHGYLLGPTVVQQALCELGIEQQATWAAIVRSRETRSC